jgi:hypothetical protein
LRKSENFFLAEFLLRFGDNGKYRIQRHGKLSPMENTIIFIKFKAYDPVAIDSAYGRGPQRTVPLDVVSALIAAYKIAVSPKFDSIPIVQLILYKKDENGMETALNSWETLASLGNIGRNGAEPLIIKEKMCNSHPYISGIQFYASQILLLAVLGGFGLFKYYDFKNSFVLAATIFLSTLTIFVNWYTNWLSGSFKTIKDGYKYLWREHVKGARKALGRGNGSQAGGIETEEVIYLNSPSGRDEENDSLVHTQERNSSETYLF